MFRWFLTVALCFFLAEGSRTALAQSSKGPGDAPAAPSARAGGSPAGSAVSPGRAGGSPARASVSPGRAAAPSGRSSGSGAAVRSDSSRSAISSPSRSTTTYKPLRSSTRGSSDSGRKADRPGGSDRPGRPGSDGKPGGGKPGGGKPGGDWDRPGKPGGGWDHSGRPGRPGNKPHRPRPNRWDTCYPSCYGSTWYGYPGYYSGVYYDDYPDYEESFRWEQAVSEPITYFSPGQFEFFEDPRLDWAAEGGLGSSPANSPPPPGTMPSPSSSRQTDSELRQYEQMMKAWR